MFKTILFDLDGTLTNPYMGITNGIIYALDKMNRPIPKREELTSFIGPPLYDEFRRKFGFDDTEAKEAVRLYREYYFNGGVYENELIEGAEQLLSDIKQSGRKICLCTSKPDKLAVMILEHFGIAKYFDFIGAATLDGKISTKIQVVNQVLENIGAKPSECVLVGDRMHDILGAHEAGMKCIAVLCGFGSYEEFTEHGADYIAENLSDVKKFI